jgi:hypothetical protein
LPSSGNDAAAGGLATLVTSICPHLLNALPQPLHDFSHRGARSRVLSPAILVYHRGTAVCKAIGVNWVLNGGGVGLQFISSEASLIVALNKELKSRYLGLPYLLDVAHKHICRVQFQDASGCNL